MTETKQALDAVLLPCPFCGNDAWAGNYVIEAATGCMKCSAKIVCSHGAYDDNGLPEAVAAWNTRALPADWKPTPEAINALPALRAYIHRIETSHPSYDNAVRIRQLEEQVEQLQAALGEGERLRGAAGNVLAHVEGSQPLAGWLRDNDASRNALTELRDAMAAGEDAK